MKNKIGIFFFCFIASLLSNNAKAQTVKGDNVKIVIYNGGTFEQTGDKTWAEFKNGSRNAVSTFTETNRDEWSVYLRKSDNSNYQFGLWGKVIRRNGTVINSITDASAVVKGYFVQYVAHSGGSFEKSGPNNWVEYKIGNRTPQFTFTETGRDEWSVYLKKSDGANLQLDLYTKKIKYNGNFLYNVTDAQIVSPFNPASSTNLITMVGTNQGYTLDQFKAELQKGGLTLVQTTDLAPNQCALVYPRANESDLAADFGVLVCAVKIGDNVTLNSAAVYGGCDASNPTTQGVGAKCEVGVVAQQLTVKLPNNGSAKFNINGPAASACGSISTEAMCASAGATLASTSFTIEDENGTGIGLSLEAGVGVGLGGSYDDGVLSGSIGLKCLVGGSITFSVNTKDVGEKIMKTGEAGYVLVEKQVRAASNTVANVYANQIGPTVQKGSSIVVQSFQRAGQDVVYFLDGSFNDVKNKANQFFLNTGNELTTWSNSVGNWVSTAVNGAKLDRPLGWGEGYLSVFNQAGYVTTVSIEYWNNGKKYTDSKNLTAGYTAQYFIPPGSTNIHLKAVGVATMDPEHIDVTFPKSHDLKKAYKIWGTIFDVAYAEVTP